MAYRNIMVLVCEDQRLVDDVLALSKKNDGRTTLESPDSVKKLFWEGEDGDIVAYWELNWNWAKFDAQLSDLLKSSQSNYKFIRLGEDYGDIAVLENYNENIFEEIFEDYSYDFQITKPHKRIIIESF